MNGPFFFFFKACLHIIFYMHMLCINRLPALMARVIYQFLASLDYPYPNNNNNSSLPQ